MKQHHCRSIKKHSHECFTYNRVILPCQPRIRCDGTCFQRGTSILLENFIRIYD